MMWIDDEIARIGAAEELEIVSRRGDGALRRPTIIWVVRHGDTLFVRSVNGPGSAWYRGTRDCHEGHVAAGGVEKDVTFIDADAGRDSALNDTLDVAYRSKYHRYAVNILDRITSYEARATTIQLVPSG